MKKPSLAEALQPMDRAASPQPAARAATATASARKRTNGGPRATAQPGRAGKKPLIGYYSPECMKQFKQITLDNDTTQQDLLAEALNDLFQKYGKAPIA
jgi:Antitoxin-like ribbon-helix-helix